MIAKWVIATIISGALAAPTVTRNYYVVQNTKTQKCSVLPKKPKSKTVVLVRGSAVYKTRAEAQAALKTFPTCNRT